MLRILVTAIVYAGVILPSITQAQLLNQPESVVFDGVRERYIVSNVGDGNIIQIDSLGVQSYLNTDLNFVAGLHIVGDTLFAASSNGPHAGLVGISLIDGTIICEVAIADMQLLNDITSDSSGYLYVTEYFGDKIYKVRRDELTYSTFVRSGLNMPNGILFDSVANRLLVINEGVSGGPIINVSLVDSSHSTLVVTGLSQADGLAEDNQGFVYISSWASRAVFRYDRTFSLPRETMITGLQGPADIYFNKRDNILAVPNFNANEVTFHPFADSDGDGFIDINDNCADNFNPDQADYDQDGFPDSCDNCPNDPNPEQLDTNDDGRGDVCCCLGLAGNVNEDPDDIADMGDLTALIAYLFIPPYPEPTCPGEANVNGEGEIDIGDLTSMINYLFITYELPEACLQATGS